VVAKRSHGRSFFDRLQPSAARRNFERARRLRDAGIATAAPLACLERSSPPAAWLVTEFLDPVVDLDTLALTVLTRSNGGWSRHRRNGLIRKAAGLFCDLERAGLYHRDLKASNILVAPGEGDDSLKACIVDLDGLAWWWPWRSRWKPVTRLAASLLPYKSVTRGDHVRFLRAYLAARGDDPARGLDGVRRMRRKAARYARAARKRKSNKLDGYSD
jgi:hypothetical protein